MSKKKDWQKFGLIVKAEDLVKYTLNITNNINRYPKKTRFTIANRIQNKSLDIYECILEANEIYPRTHDEKKERNKLQTKALTYCKELFFFIELSMELGYIDDDSCEYWGNLVSDVKNMTAAWVKQDRERF